MSYASLAELTGWMRIPDSDDSPELTVALGAATAMIDLHCDRTFTAAGTVATARVYRPVDAWCLSVDDIGSTTGLAVATDDDDDGTYEQAWAAGDFVTAPDNALADGVPIVELYAVESRTFPTSSRRPTVQVTARWGWPAVPDAVKEACMIQATKLVHRREAVFGIIDAPNAAVATRLYPDLDPDVAVLLRGYRRTVYSL